jgi:hypothetical protein
MNMETMISVLRDEEALSLRPGIYPRCGHHGDNHTNKHRKKAVSLSTDIRPHHEVLRSAINYAKDHDDIAGLTFSDHLGGHAGFTEPDTKRELWFHKKITIEGVRFKMNQSDLKRSRVTLYIK